MCNNYCVTLNCQFQQFVIRLLDCCIYFLCVTLYEHCAYCSSGSNVVFIYCYMSAGNGSCFLSALTWYQVRKNLCNLFPMILF